MTAPTARADRVAAALYQAAVTGCRAPSIHNTQPWRWRVEPRALRLFATPQRHLVATDPDGRMLTMSCGAALHHAEVALAGTGWRFTLRTSPSAPHRPLATIDDLTPGQATAADRALLAALPDRRTDRRPAPDRAPDGDALDAVCAAVSLAGVGLQLLRPDEVVELAVAASAAVAAERLDDPVRDELAYWTSRPPHDGLGLPRAVLPIRSPVVAVRNRDFGVVGGLPVGAGHDARARYGILFADADEPDVWLTAGRALSAGWLTALLHGVDVLPMSAVVECDATRALLGRLLGGFPRPYLVLRLTPRNPEPLPAGPTPRLPHSVTIETG